MTLKSLLVRDFVLLREARLDFTPGLNVLSGETGAGKSLLVNALGLALGARGSKDLIRVGTKSLHVDCCFADGLRLIRRLAPSGRNDCRVNDEDVNLAGLADASGGRVTVMSQHQQHQLLDSSNHLSLIDSLCGEDHQSLLAAYRDLFEEFSRVRSERIAVARKNARTREQRSLWEFQIEELSEAELFEGEYEALDGKQRRLNSLRDLTEYCEEARWLLTQAEEPEASVSGLLGRLIGRADELARIDRQLAQFNEKLLLMQESLTEAADWLETYSRELELDPRELEEIEERFALLEKLRRKYGLPPDELPALLERLKNGLDELTDDEEKERKLREREAQLRGRALKEGRNLARSRRKEFERLKPLLVAELSDLNMPDTRLEVSFSASLPDGTCDVELEDTWIGDAVAEKLGPDGLGDAQILVATDPRHQPKPLQKVLSGGELSRFMLAVEILRPGDESCLIMDEVDTGIGGGTATQLAEKLRRLCRSRQLVVVTHLAAIAAIADRHMVVVKTGDDDPPGNVIRVETVQGERRVEEIARMLSGEGEPEAEVLARRLLSRQESLRFE